MIYYHQYQPINKPFLSLDFQLNKKPQTIQICLQRKVCPGSNVLFDIHLPFTIFSWFITHISSYGKRNSKQNDFLFCFPFSPFFGFLTFSILFGLSSPSLTSIILILRTSLTFTRFIPRRPLTLP